MKSQFLHGSSIGYVVKLGILTLRLLTFSPKELNKTVMVIENFGFEIF